MAKFTEFLDLFRISPDLVANSILARALLFNAEVGVLQQDDTTWSTVSAGCLDFRTGDVFIVGHVLEQVQDAARVDPLVLYQHTTFTMMGSSVMPALESKVKDVGLVLKSVEIDASSV